MGNFQTRFLELSEVQACYDGTQLRSLFAYMEHGILGDSAVAWVGPCNVSPQHMVDGEDLRDQSEIRGSKMLHLILEKFEARLPEMVVLQRLLSAMTKDLLEQQRRAIPGQCLKREGDDLYLATKDGKGKLSISIATVSPVSGLIHFAINVSNQGTPVKTASLEDLGIDARCFADELLLRIASEINSIKDAACKVKWVN